MTLYTISTVFHFCGSRPFFYGWLTGGLPRVVNEPEFQGGDSLPSRVEVKKAWSYNSTAPYVFMGWCLIKQKVRIFFPNVTTCPLRLRGLYNCTITIFPNCGSVFIKGPYNRQYFHKSQVKIWVICKPCMVSLRTLELNNVRSSLQKASADFYNISEVLTFLLSFQFKMIYLWV